MAERLDDLTKARRRRSTPARPGPSSATLAGKMTARERIEYLLDDGSPSGAGLRPATSPRHGVGGTTAVHRRRHHRFGTVDGRKVCVFSQDFTVFGAPWRGLRRQDHKIMDLASSVGVR